jgi:hypothetical protein
VQNVVISIIKYFIFGAIGTVNFCRQRNILKWYMKYILVNILCLNGDHFSGIMVSVLLLSIVDREFESRSGQTIGKYWLGLNQNSVSEWRDMSTVELLFQ